MKARRYPVTNALVKKKKRAPVRMKSGCTCTPDSRDRLCRLLPDILRIHRGDLPILVAEDDLLAFRRHVGGPVARVVCMGTPSPICPMSPRSAPSCTQWRGVLGIGGTFVTTFPDYSTPLEGAARSIHVRSDGARSPTCFLEVW